MTFTVHGPTIGVVANGVSLSQALNSSWCWIKQEPAGIVIEVDSK